MSGGPEVSPGQEHIRVHGYDIGVGSELAWSDVWYLCQYSGNLSKSGGGFFSLALLTGDEVFSFIPSCVKRFIFPSWLSF